jgi:HEPN domain-containing protein
MRELTEEWIGKAEGDYRSAHILLAHGEEHIAEAVCFHCQQCAEKYLKAFLQENRVRFRREHDLMPLLEACISVDRDFEKILKDLRRLEDYAVAIRYPGKIAQRSDAESAFAAATRVRAFVRRKLGLPG